MNGVSGKPCIQRANGPVPASRYSNVMPFAATLPRWTSGRVAVIGDAAHAMPSALGQGAGVSMMNAMELADAVAGAPDVETGLATWEARLRPVIEQWQREAETVANQRTLDGAVHPGADFDVERTGDFPSLQKSEMAAS